MPLGTRSLKRSVRDSGGMSQTVQYELDKMGRPVSVVDMELNTTYFRYDDANHEVRAGASQGFKGGASIATSTCTFGLSDYTGLTNSRQYQGGDYDASRIFAKTGRAALVTAATMGVANALGATQMSVSGATTSASPGFHVYATVGGETAQGIGGIFAGGSVSAGRILVGGELAGGATLFGIPVLAGSAAAADGLFAFSCVDAAATVWAVTGGPVFIIPGVGSLLVPN